MRRPLSWICAALIAVGSMQSVGQAGIIILDANPTVLTDLLQPGASITVGDKKFSDFSYLPIGDMPTSDGVSVYPIQDEQTGDVGIRFQALFKDLADEADNGSDAIIQFDVEALDPTQYISDVHLFANPNLSSNTQPGSFGEVVEDITPGNGQGKVSIAVDEVTRENLVILADRGVQPQRKVTIYKDVALYSRYVPGVSQPNDRATISIIDQLISQVPEPSSFGLMLAMMLGLFGYGRRQQSQR